MIEFESFLLSGIHVYAKQSWITRKDKQGQRLSDLEMRMQ